MANWKYNLMTYLENGVETVSAIHDLDLGKFLAEHPEAKLIRRK